MINCYSLGELEKITLCWKQGGHRWIARYEDIFGNKYYTICQDDMITIIDHQKDKKRPERTECLDFENKVNQNISNPEIIKRLWKVQRENKDCEKINLGRADSSAS